MKTIWNIIKGTIDFIWAVLLVVSLFGIFNALFDSIFDGGAE